MATKKITFNAVLSNYGDNVIVLRATDNYLPAIKLEQLITLKVKYICEGTLIGLKSGFTWDNEILMPVPLDASTLVTDYIAAEFENQTNAVTCPIVYSVKLNGEE